MRGTITVAALIVATVGTASRGSETAPSEADYYAIETLAIPEGVVLEAGALEVLPGDRLAVASRRGEIYLVDHALAKPPRALKWTLFASGLHEVLGLAWRDGWLYATQRCELSRLQDTTGDDRADVIETVSDGWGITGDYHEYAFGSKFDREGNLWVALCLTGSFSSEAKFRGWAVRITPEGKLIPTTSGLRSPGGIGANATGDMFYTENQGPWNGACSLKPLPPGKFVGHPAGNRWYADAPEMGPPPREPESGSRMHVEVTKIPQLVPPAVVFPYPEMGQSASGIVCDTNAGRFGPFAGQLFVADQSHSTVMRVFLEKVRGVYQGACLPFRGGFASGNLAMLFGPDGSLIVGGTNRGWGSRGTAPFALERLTWTGRVPFEIHEMRARPDGFELTFTEPVDPRSGGNPASYDLETFTHVYQSTYGSPKVDLTHPKIVQAHVAADGRSVRLLVEGLQVGHVHKLVAAGVRNGKGQPLLHDTGYYTLNGLPEK